MKIKKSFKFKKYKVGDTPLIRSPELEKIYGIPNLLIKDESRNEFGTFKDRRNKLVIQKAFKNHVNKLAIITSGNAGYSLARFAKGTSIKVVCVIDNSLDPSIKEHLQKYSKVIEANLSQQIFEANENFQSHEVIELARETVNEKIWDVTNGYHQAFQSIIKEIKKEKQQPDLLITPLGSGEAYVGLYEGLKKFRMKSKLVGVGVHTLEDTGLKLQGKPSIADKLYTPYTPYKDRIEEILKDGHLYVHVSDKEIQEAYEKVSRIIYCEPSSAAVFAALPKLTIGEKSKVILINSGKGIWPVHAAAN